MPTAELLAGIRRLEDARQNRDLLDRLATQGQAPQVLFIACCDSRVSPELITGARLGDLYVARTVGNLVPPFGTGEMAIGAVAEYAVLHLRVRHAVICGHTDCGCIRALAAPVDWTRESHIARWIEHARAAQTRVEARGVPTPERHLAVVRENVLEQLEHLRSYDPVRAAERAGSLTLHGWVYRLETAALEAYDPAARSWAALS